MRSDAIPREEFLHVLAALTPQNRLAVELSLATGLRIGDVLNLRTSRIAAAVRKQDGRTSVRELKTGKLRVVRIPAALWRPLMSQAGGVWVFEHRTDPWKHRTRQAVWKDVKRAARLFRMPRVLQISPHSARKIYAVTKYRGGASLAQVSKLLNHSSEAVTMIYAMADVMTERRLGRRWSEYGEEKQAGFGVVSNLREGIDADRPAAAGQARAV